MSQHEFEDALAVSWPPRDWADLTVLVGVSGGADSVALLRGLAAIRAAGPGRLVVGHFNHGWRRAESDADEQFVGQLAGELGVGFEVGRGAGQALDEATARDERHAFWTELAGRIGARFVVTAHTFDDQAETVLHHILRGTGLAGLAGIRRARPLGLATMLRPLLHTRRKDVLAYLQAIGQPYRSDRSNDDVQYTRNRIRHEVLPYLAENYSRNVSGALVRLASLAGQAQQVLSGLAAALGERAVTVEADGAIWIDVQLCAGQPSYVVSEMVALLWRRAGWPRQAMNSCHYQSVAHLILSEAPAPAISLPGHVIARRSGQHVIVSRKVPLD